MMRIAIFGILLFLPGCVADYLFGHSDDEVEVFVREYRDKVQQQISRNTTIPEQARAEVRRQRNVQPKQKLLLDIDNAICLASTGNLLAGNPQAKFLLERKQYYGFAEVLKENQRIPPGNRGFLARAENIQRTALSLLSTEHDWNPQLRGTVSFIYNNVSGGDANLTEDLALGASQRLPYGGTASLDVTLSQTQDIARAEERQAFLNISGAIEQPLLRGFGRERAMEDVVLARRNFVYEIRAFELFRQDFSIDVIQRYYDIIRRRQVVRNNQHAHQQTAFLLEQTKALYEKLGEKSTLDVLRVELSEQQAKDALEEARQTYEEALDDFKIFLGLDPRSEIELADQRPQFREIKFDLASAEKSALNNRLDLQNSWGRLQDTLRALRYARQDLLPDLDWFLNFSFSSADARDFSDLEVRFDSVTTGLVLEIPLDRVREYNELRSAKIAFKQQVRDFLTEMDNIRREVRDAFRALRRLKGSLANQKRQIEIAQRQTRKAFLDFKEGEKNNRDLVEAQEDLRDAENAFIQTQVDYEIARLRLLRDIGVLQLNKWGDIVEEQS